MGGRVKGCNEKEGKGDMLNFNARLKGINFNILYLSAHFKLFNEKCKIVLKALDTYLFIREFNLSELPCSWIGVLQN